MNESKDFLVKLYNYMGLLKIGSICLGVIYCLFWFYRFFNGPFTDFLIPIFDFFAKAIPVPFETTKADEAHTAENAYFIMAVLLGILAFVFSIFEDVVLRMERRRDLLEIQQKRLMEEQLNKELERDYLNEILKYRHFSILIKYKLKYINEIIARSNSLTTETASERAHLDTAALISKAIPDVVVKQCKTAIFVKGANFKEFDRVMSKILDIIKLIKIKNEKNSLQADFMIIVDAQTTEDACNTSVKTLLNIAENGYFGKATVTMSFKTRFDLMQKQSKFMTDATGFVIASKDHKEEDEELFILKTKPKAI